MQSAILTSAEKRKQLERTAATKRPSKSAQKKSTPAKKRQRKQSTSSSPTDEDFCIICLRQMPKNALNLIR